MWSFTSNLQQWFSAFSGMLVIGRLSLSIKSVPSNLLMAVNHDRRLPNSPLPWSVIRGSTSYSNPSDVLLLDDVGVALKIQSCTIVCATQDDLAYMNEYIFSNQTHSLSIKSIIEQASASKEKLRLRKVSLLCIDNIRNSIYNAFYQIMSSACCRLCRAGFCCTSTL